MATRKVYFFLQFEILSYKFAYLIKIFILTEYELGDKRFPIRLF